jgi:hypothetical protein
MSASPNEKVVDAEILDEKEVPKKKTSELFADFVDAGSDLARGVGAERVADVTKATAKVARAAPAAVAAIDRETRPIRAAAKEFIKSLEDSGVLGRKPPKAYRRTKEETQTQDEDQDEGGEKK